MARQLGLSIGKVTARVRNKEFISKLESAAQELEETMYWFELLVESGIVPEAKMASLHDEADQLMAILVTSIKKVKSKR